MALETSGKLQAHPCSVRTCSVIMLSLLAVIAGGCSYHACQSSKTINKKLILKVINDPDQIKDAYLIAKTYVGTFPKNGCAATCSCLLNKAGLNISIEVNAELLARRLQYEGWEKINRDQAPRPGDVFVAIDENGNGMADHIGIVATLIEKGRYFLAVDNNLAAPDFVSYPRNMGAGEAIPVDYWLRSR